MDGHDSWNTGQDDSKTAADSQKKVVFMKQFPLNEK